MNNMNDFHKIVRETSLVIIQGYFCMKGFFIYFMVSSGRDYLNKIRKVRGDFKILPYPLNTYIRINNLTASCIFPILPVPHPLFT